MTEDAYKLKDYIEEISLIQEQDNSDLIGLQSCFEKFNFSDEQKEKLIDISMSHKKRSEELLHLRKLDGAIISMERAVEVNPFSDEFRNKLAQLYLIRAHKEGYKKSDRDLSFLNASISIKITNNNPIGKSILKEIQKHDDKISGKDLNKKFLPLIIIIVVIALAALFMEREYLFPFLNTFNTEETEEWKKPEVIQKVRFSERDIETSISSSQDQFQIQIDRSVIEKINGSYSYTIQGEIVALEKAVESVDLDINFISNKGLSLFKKTFPLVKENQQILPGEPLVLDQFFYIHYLPPDIDRININLKNQIFSDRIIEDGESRLVEIEWNSPRPEGFRIEFNLKSEDSVRNYSQSFKNMKLELENKGFMDIINMEITLSWKDQYDKILHQNPELLIGRDNPPLTKGKSRIFYLFSEIPEEVLNTENHFFITINRIN